MSPKRIHPFFLHDFLTNHPRQGSHQVEGADDFCQVNGVFAVTNQHQKSKTSGGGESSQGGTETEDTTEVKTGNEHGDGATGEQTHARHDEGLPNGVGEEEGEELFFAQHRHEEVEK